MAKTHLIAMRASLAAAAFIISSGLVTANATTIVVNNLNSAGQGFNDPTPVAPVGGNPGTTLGQQRLIAFQAAAAVWERLVASTVTIRVGAQMTVLACNSTGAVLGSAGPNFFNRDFVNAPVPLTWYPVALANALSGVDQDPGADDIDANFNSAIGTTCAFPKTWYYGLDANPPANQIDFMSVVIHELGHGLGFLTLVDLTTGAKALGFNDTFMLNLENHGASPPDYPSMTNAQRVAASISTGNLHWTGTNVRAASGVLSSGKVGDHVRMYAPNPQVGGSSVSHWDTVATPNQVMEPIYTVPLHSPYLELFLFRDIGWTVNVMAPIAHDFNGDSRSDILWRSSAGDISMWFLNGTALLSGAGVSVLDTGWQAVKAPTGSSDFDQDTKADILWRHTNGSLAIWLMNGPTVTTGVGLGVVDPAWQVAGIGDFNGDGKADILWRHSSGAYSIWFMNGTTVASSAGVGAVAATWVVAAITDLNGDGKADIVLRNTSSGDVAVWLMNGATIASGAALGVLPSAWQIVGAGDFNGDGKGDILWRHSSGAMTMWFMNGITIASSAPVGGVSPAWNVVSTGDYNGDGRADILWRSTAGDVAVFLMNGASVASSAGLGTIALSWSVTE